MVISRMRLLKKEQVYHCFYFFYFLFIFIFFGGGRDYFFPEQVY